MTVTDQPGLVGRSDLQRHLTRSVLDPGAPVVMLRGDPGVGKTSLVRAVERDAQEAGATVLTVTGAEGGSTLPYGALHRLLAPLAVGIADLPVALRTALDTAFGRLPGERSAHVTFRVALATLTLVTSRAAPVVLLVDDLQWIDADSLAVVGFVLRRTAGTPVGALLSGRHHAEAPVEETQDQELLPLGEREAELLLDSRWPGLTAHRRRRILRASAGNPLALVELPLGPDDREIGRADGAAAPLALSRRLERAFVRQGENLPPTTSMLLLAAAANSSASVSEAVRAAARATGRAVDLDDLEPAVALGLVSVRGDHVRFRHPLVRSGLLGEAPRRTLVAIHTALADLLAEDADRRVWHRSEVVDSDESVAADLVAAAERADERGAPETALVLLERAADRSADRHAEQLRAARGAEIAAKIGDRGVGDRLLQRISPDVVPWAVGLRLLLHQEDWEPNRWTAAEVDRFVASVRKAADEGNTDLALRVLERLTHSPWAHVRGPVLAAARELAEQRDEPMGLLTFAQEPRHRERVRRRVDEALSQADTDPETLRLYVTAATRAYDFAVGVEHLPGVADALLAQGRRAAAGQALVSLCWCHLLLGRLADADDVARRAEALCRETHQHFWTLGPVLVLAWLDAVRPDGTDPEHRVSDVRSELPAESLTLLHRAFLDVVRGTAALVAGRYGEAADVLGVLFARESFVRWWVTADRVEACVHAGRTVEARHVLEELADLTAVSSSRFLADQLAYGRAIAADDEVAGELVVAALDDRPLVSPVLRARLALAHGIRLRRAGRVREARSWLDRARALFAVVGPTRWDARVEAETAATRRRAPVGQGGGPRELTPQEEQVARLAADGLTNREIGARLLLSPRTVSTHLHHVFGKLAVARRGELEAALGDRGRTGRSS